MTKIIPKILSTGSALPQNIVTNLDLSQKIDTSDEWIISRTGIKQRNILNDNEATSSLAIKAAINAIMNAKIDPLEIDLIIVATTTPDKTFPSTAVYVQEAVGAFKAAAFDIQAVCAGFVYALSVAESMIKSGSKKCALIIGADAMSKIVDWQDRSTSVLFGDGAGAMIIKSEISEDNCGVLVSKIYADGRYSDILNTDGGVSTTGNSGVVKMQGKEVFKHAVEKMSVAMQEVLDEAKITMADVDYVVPHQANIRILEAIAKKMEIAEEKIVITLDKHANTSAASIPLALNSIDEKKQLTKGKTVLIAAIGGGLAWGAALIRW